MPTRPHWLRVAKYALTGFLAIWTYVAIWASSYTDPKPWYILGLISIKIAAPIAAAALIAALEIYQELKWQSSAVVMKRFLDHLHAKYFPYLTGGLNPYCRVTLFMPGSIRRWSLGVKARSGGLNSTSRVRWSIKRSENEEYHGIAGYAWATGIFVAIDGLPDYHNCSPPERLRYQRQTFITEKEASKLHWQARSYRGLVIKNQRGERIGVLMMESKLPDGLNRITAETFYAEAEYLQLFLA